MPLLPLDNFLCWKLKHATLASMIYIISTCVLEAFFELLDVIAWADKNFEVSGSFRSEWRSHVWEGWLACNLVMICVDILISGFAILMIVAIRRFPTYLEYLLMKAFQITFVMFQLIYTCIAIYKLSWYGPNTFRLPFLIFIFMYWLLHTTLNITSSVIFYSRIAEIRYEIEYGERKQYNAYSERTAILDMRSGTTTPRLPAFSASQSFA